MEVPALSYLLDVVPIGDDGDSSLVQVAKTGNFQDPRYGKFAITEKDLDTWIKNFDALNPDGLPVDRDHSPEKRGDTEAIGWVKQLTRKPGELWAKVDWNDLGRQLIGDQRYRFISPSYKDHKRDESGKDHGTTLVGIAVTNRPFLQMATVNLSQEDGLFAQPVSSPEDDEPASSDSPSQMELSKDIRKALGLPEEGEVEEAKILEAVTELSKKEEPKADEKTLDELAKDEGKVVLDAAQVTELTTKANAGESAAKELAEAKFTNAFDKALDEGRITPGQKDTYKSLYDIEPDKTLSAMDELKPVVNVTPRGGNGDTPEMASLELSDEDRAAYALNDGDMELHTKALALSEEKKIDYVDAAIELQRQGVGA